MAKRKEDELGKIAAKFGVNYYSNFRVLGCPDPENPDNEYMKFWVPVAKVYIDGRWRNIVIGGGVYCYRDGENRAGWVIHDAKEVQDYFLNSLGDLLESGKRIRNDMLSNPLDSLKIVPN